MKRWEYFNKFDEINDKYLPVRGEGETLATQAVTAVNKLIYKWYNDGDVFDNRFALEGWCNDLATYANWIYKHIPNTAVILDRIAVIEDRGEYEDLLADLAETVLNEDLLKELNDHDKEGSVYECYGKFRFEWDEEDDEEDFDDKVY